jgi:hypothetical protein
MHVENIGRPRVYKVPFNLGLNAFGDLRSKQWATNHLISGSPLVANVFLKLLLLLLLLINFIYFKF